MDQVDAFLGKACVDHADQWLALHDMDLAGPVAADAAAREEGPGEGMEGRKRFSRPAAPAKAPPCLDSHSRSDRKSVVCGQEGSIRVDLGGPRLHRKKKKETP